MLATVKRSEIARKSVNCDKIYECIFFGGGGFYFREKNVGEGGENEIKSSKQ